MPASVLTKKLGSNRTENVVDLASGTQGAFRIAGHLLDRYGEDSFEFIIDEGGSEVRQMYGTTFALPGTAEKVVYFLSPG